MGPGDAAIVGGSRVRRIHQWLEKLLPGQCIVLNVLSNNRLSTPLFIGSRKRWPKSKHHGRLTGKHVKYRVIITRKPCE